MPTFEDIKAYAQCWSVGRLRERAKLWPDPLTWEWFLGERCAQYSRKEISEILSIAVAHLQRTRAVLPNTASEIWRARESAEKPTLLNAMSELGQFFDAWEQGIHDVPPELAAALGELCGFAAVNTGGVIEALPPPVPTIDGVSLPPREQDVLISPTQDGVVFERREDDTEQTERGED